MCLVAWRTKTPFQSLQIIHLARVLENASKGLPWLPKFQRLWPLLGDQGFPRLWKDMAGTVTRPKHYISVEPNYIVGMN